MASVYLQEHKAASFQRRGLEGTMSGLLTLESGVHVSVLQTCQAFLPGSLSGFVVRGDGGTLRAWGTGAELLMAGEGSDPRPVPYPETLSEHALELDAFAEYVAGSGGALTDGRSERRTLAVVQAGYESARTGLPVSLRQRFGAL